MSQSKYEQMLQHLINEEVDIAKELFHQIVVEQSQSILRDLMDESFDYDYEDDEGDDDDDEVDEGFGGDESEDFADDVGGDMNDEHSEDDEEHDFGDDEEDSRFGEDGQEAASKDDILDIKDALAELQAEFDKMINKEDEDEDDFGGEEDDFGDEDEDEDEDDFGGEEDDFGDEDEDDFGDEDEDEDEDDFTKPKNESRLAEYTLKVPHPKGGDNGSYTRSAVASKNNMGGNASNIARNDVGGTKSSGGLQSPKYKEINTGNVNVPGGKPAGQRIKSANKPKHGDDGRNVKAPLPRQ